jgi:catechol 2,3-dioxygenase-like lactoylglutathione lyase family enzyme
MLHHVELYVSNLRKTEDFWGWFLAKLGYETYQKWEQGFSYKHDNAYIVFVQTEAKYLDVPYHRCRVGLNHLAFHAQSRIQVDEITDELIQRSVKLLYADKHPFAGGENHYAVYFEDPDRMKVELVAP